MFIFVVYDVYVMLLASTDNLQCVCVCWLLVVCRSCGGCQDRGFLRDKAWQAQLGMVWKELAKIGKPHVNTHLQLCLFVTVNFVAIHTRTQYRNRLKLGNLNRLFLQCMIDYHLNTFCPPWTQIMASEGIAGTTSGHFVADTC